MGRLAATLATLKAQGRKALSAFVTAGHPTLDATVPAMRALARGGADVIELGVPFSDPEADGPAIQAAAEQALANGATLARALDMTRAFRGEDAGTPVVLMGYLNPFLKKGIGNFCAAACAAGVDGVIVVNLPAEECAPFKAALDAEGLDLIQLVAPTTPPARAAIIAERASGFLYYVSYKGITGARAADPGAVGERIAALRPRLGGLPVLVGFGIAGGASAARVAAHADGVVVGSALVRTMASGDVASIPARLEAQAREIRAALDAI